MPDSRVTLDIVFDRSTVFRMWCASGARLDMIAKIDPGFTRKSDQKGIFHAMVETYPDRKGIRHPPFEVAIKWAMADTPAWGKLHHEAEMYDRSLADVPDPCRIAPKFYGLFLGELDGMHIACIVLEWCGGVMNGSRDEIITRCIAATVALHHINILHGNLLDGRGSHFLAASDGSLRIIDFSESDATHQCQGMCIPAFAQHASKRFSDCDELHWLKSRLRTMPVDEILKRKTR